MSKIERPIIPIGIKEDMTYEKARDVIEAVAIEITGELAKGKNELLEIYLDAIDKGIEAIEKQIPKKPEYVFQIDENKNKIYHYACPSCGNVIRLVNYDLKICNCGQKLV